MLLIHLVIALIVVGVGWLTFCSAARMPPMIDLVPRLLDRDCLLKP